MKTLYEQIKSTVRHHATSLTLSPKTAAEDIDRAIHLVRLRHPELFWLTERYDFNPEDRLLQLEYTLPSTTAENTSQRIYEVVQNDFHLQRVRYASPLGKALEVYRWLHDHCRYSKAAHGLKDTASIYDVFITGCANSEGYALAAQYLFQRLDIPVYRLSGWLRGEANALPHHWNVITLNDESYHFDATGSYGLNWNSIAQNTDAALDFATDDIGDICYHFCCLSNEALELTHILGENIRPNCPKSISSDLRQEEISKLFAGESAPPRFSIRENRYVAKEEPASAGCLSPAEKGCHDESESCHTLYCDDEAVSAFEEVQDNCGCHKFPFLIQKSQDASDADACQAEEGPCPPPSAVSYEAHCEPSDIATSNAHQHRFRNFLHHLFLHNETEAQEVYSSVFAPQEVRPGTHLMVELFFHLQEEEERVRQLASEVQEGALRRNQIALDLLIKKGERITACCQFYAQGQLVHSEQQSVVWQGQVSRSEFTYFIPEEAAPAEMLCHLTIALNGIPMGSMKFLTKIKEEPNSLHTKVDACRPNKVFISYANKDYQNVKYIAYAYAAQGIDYFFDKNNLKSGDIYEEEIYHYIDQADLFVLCWSANAAKSINVAKEKNRALTHAYPQVSREEATLEIRPVSIEPRAELPDDMKKIYQFATL